MFYDKAGQRLVILTLFVAEGQTRQNLFQLFDFNHRINEPGAVLRADTTAISVMAKNAINHQATGRCRRFLL